MVLEATTIPQINPFDGPSKKSKAKKKKPLQSHKTDADETQSNFWVDCPLWCRRKMRYFSYDVYRPGKHVASNQDERLDDYTSGESDTEYSSMFQFLPTEQKTKRILHLWKRFYSKARGSLKILKLLQETRKQIKLQGMLNTTKMSNLELLEPENLKDTRYLIMPGSERKARWNILIALLLIYTGMAVPVRVAFYDIASPVFIVFELFVDFCFIADIVLTFFTAYEKNGFVEVRHKQLAMNYLKSWFWIDLISSIPFQLMELNAEEIPQNLRYITRFLRILRLLKLFRFTKKNSGTSSLT